MRRQPWRAAGPLGKNFVLQNIISWVKSMSINKGDIDNNSNIIVDFSVRHLKPFPGERFLNIYYEFIFHFTKDWNVKVDTLAVGVPYKHKSNIKRWQSTNNEDKRDGDNIWFIPY